MTKTITRYDLQKLLDSEPDTKLKKKLLAMIEPEPSVRGRFHAHAQHVVDLMAEALGKKKLFLRKGAESYRPYDGVCFRVGKFRVGFAISIDYQDQQCIEIQPAAGGYSAVEIRVDSDNPESAISLMIMALDHLNKETK
ncbi:hypothetical protein [Corynebacterium diphtheriae]|uniref:hypothetical protein n=1 Tax=Corynebacterium diphtheriae TaxID=1717 RepID=UPI00335C37A0